MPKAAKQRRAKRHSGWRRGRRRQARAIATGPSRSKPSEGSRKKKETERIALTTSVRLPPSNPFFSES